MNVDQRDIQQAQALQPISGPAAGRTHLLAIGIDKYRFVGQLHNAVKDARDVAQLLTKKYQFGEADMTLLFDENATQQGIFSALDALTEAVSGDDVVLIYFSGHGILQNNIGEGYWVPVDGRVGNVGSFIANSLLKKYLKSIKSFHTFVISDACFSGAMFEERSLAGFALRQEGIPSRWLLTSGREQPVLDGPPGGNSPFADSLLLHLGKNQHDALSISILFDAVKEDVGSNFDQLPRCEPLQGVGHRGGEFAFRLKGSAAARPVSWASAKTGPARNGDEFGGNKGRKRPLWAYFAGSLICLALVFWGIKWLVPPVVIEHKASLSAQNARLDLGKLEPGTKAKFQFFIENKSATTAVIDSIGSSCGERANFQNSPKMAIAANSVRTFKGEFEIGRDYAQQCKLVLFGKNLEHPVELTIVAEAILPVPDPVPAPETKGAKPVKGDNGGKKADPNKNKPTGSQTAVTGDKTSGPVEPPPPTEQKICTVNCNANTGSGLKITMTGPDGRTTREGQAASNGAMKFNVPCDWLGETVRLYIKQTGKPDDRATVELSSNFQIPE